MKMIYNPRIELSHEEACFLDEFESNLHEICHTYTCDKCPFEIKSVKDSHFCPVDSNWLSDIVSVILSQKK